MRPARVGIAVGLAYIAMNGAITYLTYKWHFRDLYGESRGFIASPMPIEFWRREQIQGWREGEWYVFFGPHVAAPNETYLKLPSNELRCAWPDLSQARRTNPQLDAFLFWSRAPFAVRAADGSVILYDARFYDPRARDRFSVALPDVRCEELTAF